MPSAALATTQVRALAFMGRIVLGRLLGDRALALARGLQRVYFVLLSDPTLGSLEAYFGSRDASSSHSGSPYRGPPAGH